MSPRTSTPRTSSRCSSLALPPEKRRRPYRITGAGSRELARSAARMRTLAELGLTRLAAGGQTA